MQRVRVMVGLDRQRRGAQRMCGDLTAEQRVLPAAGLRRVPGAEQVTVEPLEVEQCDQPAHRLRSG